MLFSTPPFHNADSLQDYRKSVERELQQLTQQALDGWLKESDNAFRRALKEAAEIAMQRMTSELNAAISSSLGTSVSAAGITSGGGDLSRAISRLVVAQVSEMLSSTKTSVHSRETERSVAERNALRLSRSQQQADLARQSQQGLRNL